MDGHAWSLCEFMTGPWVVAPACVGHVSRSSFLLSVISGSASHPYPTGFSVCPPVNQEKRARPAHLGFSLLLFCTSSSDIGDVCSDL